MSRQSLGGHQNVVSIRAGFDERTSLRDFDEHLGSMESILKAFDGSEPADEHSAIYILSEALKNVPIIAHPIDADRKARLSNLYRALSEYDQKYHGKTVEEILSEDPVLKAYLIENGFCPEQV